MKADWIEIKRGDIRPQQAGLHVTMNHAGNIVMSRPTYDMLGSPEAFQLLYDRVNNRIGLQPSRIAMRNAYPAMPANRRTGSKKVMAFRLVREHRIEPLETLQFDNAEIDEDGILILDLRTARVSNRALGYWQRAAVSSE